MTPASRAAILYAYAKGYRVLYDGTLLNREGRRLKPTPASHGYPTFKVGGHRRQKTISLHVFAAYCWYGDEVFEVECVRHKDDVRTHCTYDNIVLGSRKDNAQDIPKETRLRIGRNPKRMLWLKKTAPIRAKRDARIARLASSGATHREIADIVKVHRSRVSQILRQQRRAAGVT